MYNNSIEKRKSMQNEINLKLAVEFGFKQAEKGNNLECAMIEFQKLLTPVPALIQDSTEVKRCPHCNASMKMHWHALSKGLANTLVKFRKRVIELKRNKVHIKDEIAFTKSEFTNFQKLRYHGLVAKYIDPETKQHVAGYWLLTRRGNQFCKGLLAVPARVQTFRNKISDKAQELVKVSDVLSGADTPYWEEKDDFGYDFADVNDMESITFDMGGQGKLFN